MTDELKTCCYERPGSSDRESQGCQFLGKDGVTLEVHEPSGLLFCQYHLPMSSKEQLERFGRSGGTKKGDFKELWSEDRSSAFLEDIERQIRDAYQKNLHCDLSGVVFPGSVEFSLTKFPSISFDDCHFAGPSTDFSGLDFEGGNATFCGARFTGGPSRFVSTVFSGGRVDFEDAKFSGGPVDFEDARFSGGEASFGKSEFSGGYAEFGDADFSGGRANFRDAQFSGGYACFEDAKFSNGEAVFEGAQFSGGFAYFDSVRFLGGQINFNAAQFTGGQADFRNAEFHSFTDFGASAFPRHETPADNDFRIAIFSEAIFLSDVVFGNRSFLFHADFSSTVFSKAPEFHGCTLHQDTLFPPIENFKDTEEWHAAHAYRTLRLAMKQQEAHEEEAMFWALEQRSKRNNLDLTKPQNWLPWGLSWSYDLLSEYGLNSARPLGWLVCWLLLYGLLVYDNLNATTACWKDHIHAGQWLTVPGNTLVPEIWSSCEKIVSFSIAQSARPFFIWGDYEGKDITTALGESAFTFWIKVAATFDSAVSLTLVALFILAVRRRFRMQ